MCTTTVALKDEGPWLGSWGEIQGHCKPEALGREMTDFPPRAFKEVAPTPDLAEAGMGVGQHDNSSEDTENLLLLQSLCHPLQLTWEGQNVGLREGLDLPKVTQPGNSGAGSGTQV